jgi:heat shock protein HslJ
MRIFALIALLLSTLVTAASLAATASMIGKWRIVAISGIDSVDVSRTQADFAADGRFASTIGCNRIAGKFTIHGTQIAFGPMAATRMACIPPLDQLERQYLGALAAVRSYHLKYGALIFLGADGDGLVKLERLK